MVESWITPCRFRAAAQIEKTLVLIKPDNFRFPNLRPGGVIEVFSRTGLSIIGFKVHQMSVAQAEEFYGPVLPVLEKKLGPEKRPRKLGEHHRVYGR
jgi:Nucleoside diphosphate kinase